MATSAATVFNTSITGKLINTTRRLLTYPRRLLFDSPSLNDNDLETLDNQEHISDQEIVDFQATPSNRGTSTPISSVLPSSTIDLQTTSQDLRGININGRHPLMGGIDSPIV